MNGQFIIKELTIGYGTKSNPVSVITNLSLTLEQGEIGCLLGKSGSGKSTLLRTIAGFHPLRNGSIVLNDRTLASTQVNMPPEKRRMGFMFQDFALFPHLTIEKNISFGLGQLSNAQKNNRIEEMLDLIELNQLRKCYPHALSGGQQQRVALARALAPAPELLLLDEPFSNLDEKSRTDLASDVVRMIRRERCQALMVTHNIKEAQTISDRMGFIEHAALSQWYQTSSDPSQAHAVCV